MVQKLLGEVWNKKKQATRQTHELQWMKYIEDVRKELPVAFRCDFFEDANMIIDKIAA